MYESSNFCCFFVQGAKKPTLNFNHLFQKDPNWKNHPGRENKSTCVIVTMANWEWYQKWADNSVKRRGDDYDGIKNTVGEILIEQACQLFPQIRDHIDFKDVGKLFLDLPLGHTVAQPNVDFCQKN